MERILTYTVSSEDTITSKTCSVHHLLRHRLHLTEKEISRAKFLERGILADGQTVTTSGQLMPGQQLTVCVERTKKEDCTLLPFSYPLSILYEDEDLIAVEKPPHLAVHPAHGHYSDTLINALAAYFYEKDEWIVPRVIGRLDKDTSGLMVFAKNQPAAARLSSRHGTGSFARTYLALVHGSFSSPSGTVHAPLGSVPGSLMKQEIRPDGAPALTRYSVLRTFQSGPASCSLLKVRIETGRTHQIRVHMSSIGHPLLGDPLYHPAPGEPPFSCLFSRAALHSFQITCTQPFTGRPIRLTAGLPDDFLSFFRRQAKRNRKVPQNQHRTEK